MALTRTAVRKLLNDAEFTLFEASRRGAIGELDRRQAHLKLERTRRLRDKYADLYRRQRLVTRDRTRSKAGRSGDANARTLAKSRILSEIVARFEQRLAAIEAAERRADEVRAAKEARAKRQTGRTRSPKAPARAPVARKGRAASAGFMSGSARGAARRAQLQKSRSTAIHAHLRSQGRRKQARRDRRG